MHTAFWLGNLNERDQLEDLVVDGSDIRMNCREMGWEGVEWIYLYSDRLRSLVKTVSTFGFYKR